MARARGGMADAPDLGSGPERVGGSSPLARTIFIEDFEENDSYRTVTAQIETATERPKVRFPKVIRFRRVEATIYGKTKKYPFYRLAYYVAGRRVTRSFKSYGEAKTEAERKVREIADGSQAAALTGEQSRDALAALQRLENFRQSTGRRYFSAGRRVGIRRGIGKIEGAQLGRGRRGIFANRRLRPGAKTLPRPSRSFLKGANTKPRRKTANALNCPPATKRTSHHGCADLPTFPATAVCDLTKDHLDLYFKPLTEVGRKKPQRPARGGKNVSRLGSPPRLFARQPSAV